MRNLLSKTLSTLAGASALGVMAYGLWVFGASDLFNKASQIYMADVPVMNWMLGIGVFIAALLGWHNRNREFD